jgi:hypothetical protein
MARVLITDAIGIDIDHLDIPGSVTIGNDETTDTLEVVAGIASDLIPDSTLTRNLGHGGDGSPGSERQWAEVHQVAGVFTCGRVFCEQFSHTTSITVQNDIEVLVYTASDFVGGRITVHMKAQGSSNTGIREYVFATDETLQSGMIDLIGGAQAFTGTQPLDSGASVTYVAASGPTPAQFLFTVQNVDDVANFPIGTTFEGRCVVSLLDP